jgi:hypothetical protein
VKPASEPRKQAEDWKKYFDFCEHLTGAADSALFRQGSRGFPTMRDRLLKRIEEEISKAIQTGNADFLKKFAYFLERPEKSDKTISRYVREWLNELHENLIAYPQGPFTMTQLRKWGKAKHLFPDGMNDETIDTILKRLMKEAGYGFKNSKG